MSDVEGGVAGDGVVETFCVGNDGIDVAGECCPLSAEFYCGRRGEDFSSNCGLKINGYKPIQRQRDRIGEDIVYRRSLIGTGDAESTSSGADSLGDTGRNCSRRSGL